jgi:hypothetical protein
MTETPKALISPVLAELLPNYHENPELRDPNTLAESYRLSCFPRRQNPDSLVIVL